MLKNNKTRVLVMHDSLMMCFYYCDILVQGGYEVEITDRASEGMRKALIQPFDIFLICADIPELANYEFIKNIRADLSFCKTLTIMISYGAKTSDILAALNAGVDIYLHKPVTAEEIYAHMCVYECQTMAAPLYDETYQREYITRRFGGYQWSRVENKNVSFQNNHVLNRVVMAATHQCLLNLSHIQSSHWQQTSKDIYNRVSRILTTLRSASTAIDMPSVRLTPWFQLLKYGFSPDSITALIYTVELIKENMQQHLLMMQEPRPKLIPHAIYETDAPLSVMEA